MKILIFGPKARYDLFLPDFVRDMPVEPVFCGAPAPSLRAAADNPDAEVIFADAITPVSREMMDLLPNLKMIHSEGVAFNAIDIEAAREKGVFVCNNKGCNAASVAEHAVMLMLMALRCGVTGHRAVLAGEQIKFKERFMVSSAPELGEQTVGIIGLGDIGTAAAKLLRPFGCKLYYYTAHRRPPEAEAELGVEYLPLEELAGRCDILSLHCAVNEQTTHMVNEEFLSHVKPGAVLVNTARGQLVDNLAVRRALWGGPPSTPSTQSPPRQTIPWWTCPPRRRTGPSFLPTWAGSPAASFAGPTGTCGAPSSCCWRAGGPALW